MRLIHTSVMFSLAAVMAFSQTNQRATADASKQPGNQATVGASDDPKNQVSVPKSVDTDLRTGESRTGADGAEAGDREFVNKAAEAGHGEIGMAHLALTKSQNAKVKDYARMLVKDHTKANKDLLALAKKNGVALQAAGPGGDLSHPVPDGGASQLADASSSDFDRLYIARQVEDHKKAVELFENESKHGNNAALKQFAERTLPTLRSHLAQAEALKNAIQ